MEIVTPPGPLIVQVASPGQSGPSMSELLADENDDADEKLSDWLLRLDEWLDPLEWLDSLLTDDSDDADCDDEDCDDADDPLLGEDWLLADDSDEPDEGEELD